MSYNFNQRSTLKMFKIRKGELEKTVLMFLFAFNWVAAFLVGRVLKDTLFLSKSDLSLLPYMYIIVAAVVPATLLYSRLANRVSLRKVGNITMGLIVVTLLFYRYLLYAFDNIWVVASLYVFIEIMGVMLMILFWTFANELFNSREAKRLFGIIGSGLVLANLYGFPLRAFKDIVGIHNLIFVCIFSVLACIVIFNYLSKQYRLSNYPRSRYRHKSRTKDKQENERAGIYAGLRNNVFFVTAITTFTVVVVDYQFKVTASHYYSGDKLADFFFSVYAYTGLVAFVIQFFLTSRLLEKFGIWIALMILPLALFGSSAIALGFVGIWGIFATKGSELVTRYTITDTTTQILYQPLPKALRRQTKAFADGVVRPAAIAIAGICFVLLNYLFSINEQSSVIQLSWLILILIVIWFVVLVSLRHRYLEALLMSSDRRSRMSGMDAEEDEKSLAVSRMLIQKTLSSDDEIQILNAIEVIPLSRWSEWDEHMQPLLKSPFAKVRERVVQYLGDSGNRKYSRKIAALFDDENDYVRAAAIQTYCLLENERAVKAISVFLSEKSPLVKGATITGLIQYGGLDGILSSTVELKKMVDHVNKNERKSGAMVLGYIKIRSFYQPLFRLINDPELEVRQTAILAAGQMGAKELIPNLLYKLQDDDTKHQAIHALAGFGEEVLDQLNEVLLINRISPKIRYAIPSILAMIESPASYAVLEELMEAKDAKLRSEVMRAMQKLFARLESDVRPKYSRIQSVLYSELESYYQFLVYIENLKQQGEEGDLLAGVLEDHIRETLKRAFYLMSIIYPREQIEIVSFNLRSQNSRMRANAIEIVDNICEPETRKFLLPILDGLELSEKVLAGKRLFKLNDYNFSDLLSRFLSSSGDNWLTACTIHTIGKVRDTRYFEEVMSFADHEDPTIREAVIYASSRLKTGEAKTKLKEKLKNSFALEKDAVVRLYLDYRLDA